MWGDYILGESSFTPIFSSQGRAIVWRFFCRNENPISYLHARRSLGSTDTSIFSCLKQKRKFNGPPFENCFETGITQTSPRLWFEHLKNLPFYNQWNFRAAKIMIIGYRGGVWSSSQCSKLRVFAFCGLFDPKTMTRLRIMPKNPFHVHSTGMPPRLHPLTLRAEDQLNKLRRHCARLCHHHNHPTIQQWRHCATAWADCKICTIV